MKKILLYLTMFFFAFSLYAQQDSLVNFYLNDANIKQFKIADINKIGIIKGNDNYLMKIFYQDSLTEYFITSSIDSLTFNSDTSQINVLGIEHKYAIHDIDSICFNLIETKIADNVKVIDSTKTNEIKSIDSSNVTLNRNTKIGDSLKVGDIIASEPTEIAPNGFLRRVKSIIKDVDSIVVETEDAILTDVIENGIISIKRKFTPADTGKPYIKLEDKIQDDEGFTVGFKDIVIYDYDGNKNTKNDQIKIDGTNTFNPELGFNVVIEKWKVRQVIVKLTVEDNLELTAHGNIEKEVILQKSLNELLGIPPIQFPPITIWIFGIPVVVTSSIDLQIGCLLKIGAEVSTGITADASAIAGIEYNSGNWKPISGLTSSFQFDPPELSLGGSLKPFLGPQINVNFYKMQDAFNAYANVLGFAELKVDLLNKPLWELWSGVEGNAGIESEWFDMHKELPLVINYKRKLAQATDLIDKVEPGEGKVGEIIKITGDGFGNVRGSSYVGFKTGQSLLDKYEAIEYPLWSDKEIQIKIPNGLTAGDVKLLVNVGGFLSNMTNFKIIVSNPTQISVHVHSPEGKEIGSILVQDGWSNSVNIYVDNVYKDSGSDNVSNHPRLIEVTAGDREVKVTFNGMTLTQTVHINENQTLVVTFDFTRIETFDLLAWLDATSPRQYDFVFDYKLIPGEQNNDLIYYYLDNDMIMITKDYSFTNNILTPIHVYISVNLTTIISSSIFSIIHNGTSSFDDYVGNVYVGMFRNSGVSDNINIPIQSFTNWYRGQNNAINYPNVSLNGTKIIVSGTGKSIGTISALSAKTTIKIETISEWQSGHYYDKFNLTHFSDWEGTLENFFFSSIPKDLTGLAI
ncbi:MAG: hypothetical protein EPN82_05885 [Bacteroidetes bacterium]|nr:MAG: hypothetical protein EPN82_05885 [Bacteroidota bacterium]